MRLYLDFPPKTMKYENIEKQFHNYLLLLLFLDKDCCGYVFYGIVISIDRTYSSGGFRIGSLRYG